MDLFLLLRTLIVGHRLGVASVRVRLIWELRECRDYVFLRVHSSHYVLVAFRDEVLRLRRPHRHHVHRALAVFRLGACHLLEVALFEVLL